MQDINNIVNRRISFRYEPINTKVQVRLLQISYGSTYQDICYKLNVFSLADLSSTRYRALSYT
ncbi:hypothetical protein F4779DRAFT_456546 [Xylariaceae sp. FL0662B]|nr:hypothetical protein F4779DRAFT_456546 [Xylariaceae sp. FL0662B]